ncbi:BACON domain-containing protein [Bacteroides stercorirosoris]|uniref:BACON domain-containing protein n=1 Tax=Bacteroides stercorirosoris TaxID=871324 RepID=UPI0035227C42
MKKIINILILALCTMVVGCGDDDDAVKSPELTVISTDAQFTYKGGTGLIKVFATSAVEATAADSWCHISVSDQDISLSVDLNTSISSRTTMVTIRSANAKTEVPVTQLGDTFICDLKDVIFAPAGGDATFSLDTKRDVKVTVPQWITYRRDENQIIFTAPAIQDGGYRTSTVVIDDGSVAYTAGFTQMNLNGVYDMLFTNGGKRYAALCKVESTGEANVYQLTTKGMPVDAAFQATYSEGHLVVSFGQYLGDIDPYKVYLCAYDNVGTLGWGTTVQYVAPIATDENYNMIFVFADNGTWQGQHVDGFYYGAFTGTPSNSTYKGGYGTATDIVMQTHLTESTD